SDPTQLLEIEQASLSAYVKADTFDAATKILLTPCPQPGDHPGRTSCFTGTLPIGVSDSNISMTIPNLQIHGGRYHARFAAEAPTAEMPTVVSPNKARDLYLVPAGKYTLADIEENGRLTAAQKYRTFQPSHDP